VILADAKATHEAGAAFAPHVRVGDVIALSGPLGSGKTSFARGLLTGLGFSGEAPSPSFALVIGYEPPALRLPVWHVDLYRLDDAQEAEELGLDEARSEAVLIIEWPQRLGTRLWPDALKLDFLVEGSARRLTVQAPPSWEARCPFR
jgi:tRNA threonylcarbamoyladenosine biosynthesis protein TsaE